MGVVVDKLGFWFLTSDADVSGLVVFDAMFGFSFCFSSDFPEEAGVLEGFLSFVEASESDSKDLNESLSEEG